MRRGGVGDLGRYVGRGPAVVRRGGTGVGTGPGGSVGGAPGKKWVVSTSEEEESALQVDPCALVFVLMTISRGGS